MQATIAAARAPLVLAGGAVLASAAFVASLTIVATIRLSPAEVFAALFSGGISTADLIVRELLLPRAIVAALVGANLAVAGALIQAVTRNPLTESSIVGVNAGAALAVVVVTVVIGLENVPWIGLGLLPAVAFVGALLAALVVYALASAGGVTPVRLALAGVTVAIFAQSLVLGAVLLNETAVRFLIRWMVGGADGMTWRHVGAIAPYSIAGLVVALGMARAITVLALGEDVARGLGQRVELVRLGAICLVAILAGAAVSVTGPVALVGLVVPHIVRPLVGVDHRIVIPACILFGAALVIGADFASRLVAPPSETPLGILTAVLGTPFFIYLARRGRGLV